MGHEPKNITRFVVGGASKRGWTTWLTAAVDPRVVGIVPVVIDILGMDRQLDHHKNAYGTYPATSSTYAMYGGYSTAIQPYTQRNIFTRLNTPAGESLRMAVDPYTYIDRLTMPKLIINSTGDQFFLPDGIQFYFDHLPGKNYLFYVPNTDHGLGFTDGDYDMILGLLNFVKSFFRNHPGMPRFSWSFESDGTIHVTPEDEPINVYLWQAHTPTHRDFRLQTMGAIWQQSVLTTPDENGTYIASVPTPTTGWTGFYVQLQYEEMSLCSGLRVLPESYGNGAPYPDTHGPKFTLDQTLPSLARVGTAVTLMFTASEPLAAVPEATVNGHAAAYVSGADNVHTLRYVVLPEDGDGPASIRIAGKDAMNNPGSAVFSAGLVVDSTPPQCTNITVAPAAVRPGETVSIGFDVSEELLGEPMVLVNGNTAVLTADKSTAYVFSYTMSDDDARGAAEVSIAVSDLAGNVTGLVYTDLLTLLETLPLRVGMLALVCAVLLSAGVLMLHVRGLSARRAQTTGRRRQ